MLIILAGITITALSNSGLFNKAKQAAEESKLARHYEEIQMEISAATVEYYAGNKNNFSDILIGLLEQKGYTIDSQIGTDGKGTLEIETADGYIIIIDIDNNGPKATIDKEESGIINYDATITYNANSSEVTAETVTQPARKGHKAKLKTKEQRILVTGVNCNSETALKEMKKIKEKYNKVKGGNTGYHAYQSFKTGEVSAEEAHKIGLELAEKMWSEYQVVVATHLNTGTYHNHFVINSVNMFTGEKFDCNIGAYYWLASAYISNCLWNVDISGSMYDNYSYCLGVRPVVSLQSGVYISGGSGTESNPYILAKE